MKKLIKNYDGELFEFRVADINEISVLEVGYTINLEGEFIPVKDGENHAEVFTAYINDYLGEKHKGKVNEALNLPSNEIGPITLDSLESAKVLVSLNHVIYYGIRPEDAKDIYQKGSSVGYCVILVPDNYKETLTEEQRNAILTLIATNQSVFGTHEKVELHFNMFGSQNDIDREDIMNTLRGKSL